MSNTIEELQGEVARLRVFEELVKSCPMVKPGHNKTEDISEVSAESWQRIMVWQAMAAARLNAMASMHAKTEAKPKA